MVVKIVVVVVVVATHLTLDRIVPDANILSYSKCRFTNINERFSFRRGTLGEWNIPWSTCLHDLFLMGDSLLHVGCLLHWFFSCCICFPFFFFLRLKLQFRCLLLSWLRRWKKKQQHLNGRQEKVVVASLDSVEKVARLIYSTGAFVFQKSGRGVMCHVS